MAILASDTFDRASPGGSLGTSTSGHTWQTLFTSHQTSGNQVTQVGSSGGWNFIDVGEVDVTMTIDVVSAGAQYGFVIRAANTSNFATVYVQSGTIKLDTREGGSWTGLPYASTSYGGATPTSLKVKVEGLTVYFYVNDVLSWTTTLPAGLASQTGHGIFSSGSPSAVMDNWNIRDIPVINGILVGAVAA